MPAVENGILTISGEHEQRDEKREKNYLCRTRKGSR
jgi:HSP20 family molecular chaperone IbpA